MTSAEMDAWSKSKPGAFEATLALLKSFGYTLADLRINSKSQSLLYPVDIQEYINAIDGGRLSAFSRLTPEIVGMEVKMHGLSDDSLNGRCFRIIKVYPEEDRLQIDATPSLPGKGQPHIVRYVKVPASKVAIMYYPRSNDGLNARSCMAATNRDIAFKKCGFDALNVECLQVRPHPSVELGRMWRDIPDLCDRLNQSKASGYPFRIEIGYQIFGMAQESAVAEMLTVGHVDKYQSQFSTYETYYSAEVCMILRDCRGCGIDMAPDLGALKQNDGMVTEAFCKLYMPEPRFNCDSWDNMAEAISMYVEYGFMPTAPHAEEVIEGLEIGTRNVDRSTSAVNLGMIRGDLNKWWPDPTCKVIGSNPFTDSGLTLPHPENSKMVAGIIEQRRRYIVGGSVILSSNLATSIAAVHKDDHLMGGKILSHDELGTICFSCYCRITVEESMVCNGCGKARYCSKGCQLWHWPQHRACCASPEERKIRREAQARARKEREEQLRRHAEHETLAHAETAAKEATRKALAQRTRATRMVERANEVAERIRRAAPKAQPQGGKGKSRAARRTVEQQLVHAAWNSDDERAARVEAFNANQEADKLEAAARKAQEKVEGLKRLAKDASATAEAATHHVPALARLSEVFEALV